MQQHVYGWYAELTKPAWAPEAWVFGPVWSVLYVIIAISFGYVCYATVTKRIPRVIAIPFALNLLFNLIFSPLQFGLQSLLLATIDIILVLATLMWSLYVVWPHARWVTLINIPYAVWVAFATVLQVTVTVMNW